jgi:sulfur-oxidizing protein SoxZ
MVARVQVPAEVKRGDLIPVRIAIQHPMETGFRFDHMGRPIPKNVVNTLTCSYNGAEVFRAEMGSGISANPYLQFYTRAVDSGELVFEWVDDTGQRGSERVAIKVAG